MTRYLKATQISTYCIFLIPVFMLVNKLADTWEPVAGNGNIEAIFSDKTIIATIGEGV